MGLCETNNSENAGDSSHLKEQETHNSLPRTSGFLKYPTGRDQPLKTSQRWLEGKRIDDDVGEYWRVHDKLYDLTDFIDKHPGGRDWIAATQGSDITEVFESSHVNTTAESLLPKYYVRDATTPRNSPFTFHQDGFYRKFKKRARSILTKVGTGPTLMMLAIMDGLTLSFVALAISATLTQSTFQGIIAGEEKLRPEYVLPTVEFIVMSFLAPTLLGAFRTWVIVHASSSCLLGFIGLILSHHHPDTYHEGDMPRECPDWGLCQLDATRDRCEVSGNLFLVVTTLGDHSLHHLLPTVDHSKLHYLYPLFFEMCNEYGIPYRFYSQWEMFLGKYRALSNNAPNTSPPGYK